MKRMDVFSPHYQNEVIHQCHYSGFICVLACIQVVLGLLQSAKVRSLHSCKTYFLLQAEPPFREVYLYFCEYRQPDKKLSKMLTQGSSKLI